MDDDDMFSLMLLALLGLVVFLFLTSGCAMPGIDNHKSIFSAPRPPAAVYSNGDFHP